MRDLIDSVFAEAFDNPLLREMHDGTVVNLPSSRIAMTTDSYVVKPLFFPGGDIGILAINGTVNDLAMCGATPLYLTVGFILEEGLEIEVLQRIVQSMKFSALAAGVSIITGDTKVVDKGKGDGVYINTAGVGVVPEKVNISPRRIKSGDAVILSGDIGRHGIAVMSAREGLNFETTIQSDCAPLSSPVAALIDAGIDVHCLRDLTRGGLGSALVEIAESAKIGVEIWETSIQVLEEVSAACEIMGFDPLYIANEGRFIAFVPAEYAEKAVEILRSYPVSREAVIIGKVVEDGDNMVRMQTVYGSSRVIDMLSGEQLPRIC